MSSLDDPAAVFLDGVGRFRLWPLAFADDGDGIAIPGAGDAQPISIVTFIGVYQQQCKRQAEQHGNDLFALIAIGGGGFDGERSGVAVAERMDGAAFTFITDVYAFTAASSRGKTSRLPHLSSNQFAHTNQRRQRCLASPVPTCRPAPMP